MTDMKRKVVKQGHNALTVTLPAKWARRFNLSGGSEVDVLQKERQLIIAPETASAVKKTTLKMSGSAKYAHRYLGVLYRLGYDEVRIEFESPKTVDRLQEEIEHALGYEMLEQGENYCIIKNVASGSKEEFEATLRRIFSILLTTADNSLEIIQKNELQRLENIKQFGKINNRLTNFCERLLNKEGYKDSEKTTLVYCMIWALEQIADEYTNVWGYLLEKSKNKKYRVSKDLINLYSRNNRLLDFYFRLFYHFDVDGLSRLREQCLDAINETKKAVEKEGNAAMLSLHNITEKIYHMTESLI